MGNWRTVRIIGTCDSSEVDKLREAIKWDYRGNNNPPFHCLSNATSLCGLNDWPDETINREGNLAERGYDVEDVAKTLEKLLLIAPSLNIKIHCGGEYESTEVIATIICANGKVEIKEPEINSLEW